MTDGSNGRQLVDVVHALAQGRPHEFPGQT
jgi:hypothetical protein